MQEKLLILEIVSLGYDSVSDEIIWRIVKSHLPKLKIDVEKLLNN